MYIYVESNIKKSKYLHNNCSNWFMIKSMVNYTSGLIDTYNSILPIIIFRKRLLTKSISFRICLFYTFNFYVHTIYFSVLHRFVWCMNFVSFKYFFRNSSNRSPTNISFCQNSKLTCHKVCKVYFTCTQGKEDWIQRQW